MPSLFPSYKEVATALLFLIYSKGGTLKSSDSYELLADHFDLSEQARTITREQYFERDNHHESAWHCLVQWGRRDLVKAGFIDKQASRGVWRLTGKGKNEASFMSAKYPDFKRLISSVQAIPANTPRAIDIKRPNEINRIQYNIYRILRDTCLARQIKVLHKYKCQICGQTLQLGEDMLYAEAHHIKPLGAPHNGPDIPENIICVCPNHHALLDYGAIELNEANLSPCAEHKVGSEYIHYHNTKISGKL